MWNMTDLLSLITDLLYWFIVLFVQPHFGEEEKNWSGAFSKIDVLIC